MNDVEMVVCPRLHLRPLLTKAFSVALWPKLWAPGDRIDDKYCCDRKPMRYLGSIDWRPFLSGLLLCALCFSWAPPALATNFDRQSLRQQSFAGQDLRGNNYTSADLAESDLSNTNLIGVRLFDTNLTDANLENANLTGATLDGARFIRANLKNAILEGAYAFSTDFRKANIEGTDFTDVDLDVKTNDMLCEVAMGTNSVTGRATKDTLYCP